MKTTILSCYLECVEFNHDMIIKTKLELKISDKIEENCEDPDWAGWKM
jgi:hypothetical protein